MINPLRWRLPCQFKSRVLLLILLLSLLGGCAAISPADKTEEQTNDVKLTMEVKAALIETSDLAAAAIEVDTFKGVVQLNGFVETASQRQRAGTVASEVPGVQRVTNNLVVK